MNAAGGRGGVIIVGGGLAGLTCAVTLARAGTPTTVLEARHTVGGRAGTWMHEGRPVDEGFQVVFPAYPSLRRLMGDIGLPAADLRAFREGAVFHDGARWHRLGGGRAGIARFGALNPADRARFVRFAAGCAATPVERLLAEDSQRTALQVLREAGFGPEAVEGVFRPLFGVVFLDRTLETDGGYLRFLVRMLARGGAAMPSDGLGMVSEWARSAVTHAGGAVRTDAPVRELLRDDAGGGIRGVRLEGGDELQASAVVLAVEAPAAHRLLAGVDDATARRLPTDAASVTTAAFALARPLYRGRAIVLNAAPDAGDGPRVDLVCQTSNVTRPGAVGGPHILLASSVTTGGPSAVDSLEAAVGRQVRRWSPGYDWERLATPLGVRHHAFAQYRPLPGVRTELPGVRTAVAGLYLAGDLTRHPSIEGAIGSGCAAAEAILARAG